MSTTPRFNFGDPDAPLIEQLGGPWGVVKTGIPVLAFVPANQLWGLQTAIMVTLGVSACFIVWAVARRENLQPAFAGLFGVAIASFIAYQTGEGRGYFLFSIARQVLLIIVFLVSLLIKWPLVGVVWTLINGLPKTWRSNAQAVKYYSIATATWMTIFIIRSVVMAVLYVDDNVVGLGIVQVVTGWPLAAVAVGVTAWCIRQVNQLAIDEPADHEQKSEGSVSD